MDEIKAGVTVMQDFCRQGTDLFKSYIDYLDREETQRNNGIQAYNLYHDYMGNPEKTTGLFTSEKDTLTLQEKRELKEIFNVAQDNDSIMWQTVISFDNRWLEHNGLYDSEKKFLDEKKIKEVARMSVNRMLEKEGLENAVWSAAIHYNTDNIHVHVATVEPYPMRELQLYKGQLEYRGKFKLKNIEACKSSVVNEIMLTREVNLKINNIIRNRIVKEKQGRRLAEDPDIRASFLQLYDSLPDMPKNMLNYNNKVMSKCHPIIDSISKAYLEKYHSQEYAEFLALLKRQNDLYSEAYGRSDKSYEESKKNELFQRLGNAVLKEVKIYGENIDKKIKEVEMPEVPISMWPIHVGKPELKSGELIESNRSVPIKGAVVEVLKVEADIRKTMPKESQIEQEAFSLKLSRRHQRAEISSTLQREMEQMEYFLNLNDTRECESEKNQFFKREDMGKGKSALENKYDRWFKEFKALRIELNPEKDKDINVKAVMKGIENGEKDKNPFILHLQAELMQNGRVLSFDLEGAQQCFLQAFEIFKKDETELSRDCGAKEGFRFDKYVQYRIGKQYNRGLGIEIDNVQAAYWFEKSGTSYAKYALGNLYYNGDGVEQDYEVAFELYEEVSDDNAFASLKCAEMYKKGLGCDASIEDSERYYEKAFGQFMMAEEKQPDELYEYQLGRMLFVGEGCVPNLAQSIEYLEMAAEKKNIYAEYLVSKIYIDENIDEKIPKAIERLTELADKGEHSNAQYALGKLYADIEKEKYYNLEKGLAYLEAACSQEHEYAQYFLGKLYTDSEREIYDMNKGIGYLELSAVQGNEFAQYRLGKLYTDSTFEIYDLLKGIGYLELSAEQENEFALYQLGKLYTNSELKIYDMEKGIGYLQRSAEQGNGYAQYYLGKLYLDPESDVYYLRKGIDYMEQAVCNGNEQAQYVLGAAYLNKEGEIYNPEKGIDYIIELAEKGNMYAQTKLGCEYLKGDNVERDINVARNWFSEAAKQGEQFATDILKDMQSYGMDNRKGRGLGELDKALRSLQRSMDEEHQETIRSMKLYELEQEREPEQLEV